MASSHPTIGEAFRLLQAGDARGAFEVAHGVLALEPANARAHLASGIALRMGGRLAEAETALARAQALDPRDHAAAYEIGIVHQLLGRRDAALEAFERSARLRPEFFAAHFSAGLMQAEKHDWVPAAANFRRVLELLPGQPEALLNLALALGGSGRHEEAEATFVQALASHPAHAGIVRAFGQYSASRGNFRRAASLFTDALRQEPDDAALPMYLAQCELLSGRWAEGWAAYARREPRRQFEHARAGRGLPHAVPAIAQLQGRVVTIAGEQGLGDMLFFLRWAPALREAGVRLHFAGDERLHPLLARTSLFESLEASEAAERAELVVLAGDLPAMQPQVDPLGVKSLRIAPLAERVARWEAALRSAGPAPWIGVQWRAGTPPESVRYALSKNAPLEPLFAALASTPGTLISIQRGIRSGELELARQACGRRVHDFSHANEELEDMLALVTRLDRHVAVSSTTLHLVAAAGATADVLVPFPPEWRWRAAGNSPWFPGFRVHRQCPDGDWSAALTAAALGPQGIGLQ